MPILLEENLNFSLPHLHKVRQIFPRPMLENIEQCITYEISKPEIRGKIEPGARVAVAIGSRGIRNLAEIVKVTLEQIKSAGGKPFIVSAMGSHGGGTAEGQREILFSYGITEEAMGVDIVTSIDVTMLGSTSTGIDVYFDTAALNADMVVPINRIKLHTDFVSEIQSGLCKMLVIGLGNHIGCTAVHEASFDIFGEVIIEAAQLIMSKTNVGFGIAIVENAYDETALIEAIEAKNLIKREKALVQIAKSNMPLLMIPEIDVLIVKEIGKNISGAGYDPNILGRSYLLKEFVLPVPKINRMVLLDVTDISHGNAIGMGAFDVITRKVYDKLDLSQIYANAIAVKCPEDAKIPLIAENEREALLIAIQMCRGIDKNNLRIVKIKNTIELETIEISDALRKEAMQNKGLELI